MGRIARVVVPKVPHHVTQRGNRRQETSEISIMSPELAAKQNMLFDNRTGTLHPKGVWLGEEDVREMTLFSDQNRLSISLLLYPDDAPGKWDQDLEDPTERGTYEQFVIGG